MSKDDQKTKKQLIDELQSSRQKVADVEQHLAHLKDVYDQAHISLSYLNTDLQFLHINSWLATINGFPVEEHLGMPHPLAARRSQAERRRWTRHRRPIKFGGSKRGRIA